jgi:large subunit ribosomal protein L21
MSYAIIRTGGKQYRVTEGAHLRVDLLGVEKGAQVTFDDVLLVNDGSATKVGTPKVDGASVTATVTEGDAKGKKVFAYKMKRTQGYHKKIGHRQRYTRVKIDKIVG